MYRRRTVDDDHEESIVVPDDAWVRGGSEKDADVSPWYVTTVKHRDFDTQQGTIADSVVSEVVDELDRYTELPDE